MTVVAAQTLAFALIAAGIGLAVAGALAAWRTDTLDGTAPRLDIAERALVGVAAAALVLAALLAVVTPASPIP